MQRANLSGRWVEYEDSGSGEPLLLVHGTLIADLLAPLGQESDLEGYRLIRYRRRGFFGNPLPEQDRWMSIADHARDAADLLAYLGIDEAHVLGDDLGGVIALQLALDRPSTVHSLILMEPLLLSAPGWDIALEQVAAAIDLYISGDQMAAVTNLLKLASDPQMLDTVEERLPGALKQAAQDAPAFFGGEVLALGEWRLPDEAGYEITQPILSVLCERPLSLFVQGRAMLYRRFPQTEQLDIYHSDHLMSLENPRALAAGLAGFLRRHPIPRRVSR